MKNACRANPTSLKKSPIIRCMIGQDLCVCVCARARTRAREREPSREPFDRIE